MAVDLVGIIDGVVYAVGSTVSAALTMWAAFWILRAGLRWMGYVESGGSWDKMTDEEIAQLWADSEPVGDGKWSWAADLFANGIPAPRRSLDDVPPSALTDAQLLDREAVWGERLSRWQGGDWGEHEDEVGEHTEAEIRHAYVMAQGAEDEIAVRKARAALGSSPGLARWVESHVEGLPVQPITEDELGSALFEWKGKQYFADDVLQAEKAGRFA